MSKQKTPEIRFKGFSGDWERRTLGAIAEFTKGHGFSKSDLVSEGFPIILYGRLYTKYETIISEVDTFVADNSNAVISKGNEVIVPSSGETSEDISRASVVGKQGVILGGDLNIIYPNKEINSVFLAICVSNGTQQKEMIKRAQGKSVVHLRNSDLNKIVLKYPTNIEQTQIGNFFKNLDNLIALNQRKYDKLVNVKKSCLEKIFPKNGAHKPEMRFKGFSGDWEEKMLGEVTDVYDGTHQTPKYTESGIMFLSVEDIQTLHSEKYISKEAFLKDFKVYPEKGDILMTRIGDIGTANVVENSNKKAFYVSLALLKKKGLNSYFLKESIHSYTVKKDLWHRTLHIAFPKKINKNEISKVDVFFPKEEAEQTKIGNFFKTLDKLIALRKTELDKLKNIKKSCLEKMFI